MPLPNKSVLDDFYPMDGRGNIETFVTQNSYSESTY